MLWRCQFPPAPEKSSLQHVDLHHTAHPEHPGGEWSSKARKGLPERLHLELWRPVELPQTGSRRLKLKCPVQGWQVIGVVADSPVASAAFASTMGWVLRAVSPHRLLHYMNFGLSSQCHPTGTGGSTPPVCEHYCCACGGKLESCGVSLVWPCL